MNLKKKCPSLVRLFDAHGHYAASTTRYHGTMLDPSVRNAFISLRTPHHTHIACKQNHTATVAAYTKAKTLPPEFDGIVTKEPNTILSIITADCVPIVYVDPYNNVMGVSHQGWRGTLANMSATMIDAMKAYGAQPEQIHIAIGPCIRKESYEVDRSLLEQFTSQYPHWRDEYVHVSSDTKGYLDLPALNKRQLVASGIVPHHICDSGICTYTHTDSCYSYRRQGKTPQFGEMLTFIQSGTK